MLEAWGARQHTVAEQRHHRGEAVAPSFECTTPYSTADLVELIEEVAGVYSPPPKIILHEQATGLSALARTARSAENLLEEILPFSRDLKAALAKC